MNYKIKEIPQEERPRERLKQLGVEHLSNKELLAIICNAAAGTDLFACFSLSPIVRHTGSI